jgi:GNAT superfamily N-acetyltransferase
VTPVVRRARPEDADRLAHVYVSSGCGGWAGHLREETLGAFTSSAEEWEDAMADPEVSILVGELDGEIASVVTLLPSDEPDLDSERVAKLGRLYTEPSAWGMGLGTILMAAFMEELERRGYREAILWTAEWNRARRFYEARGWRRDGATRKQSLADETWTEVRYRIEVRPGQA